MKSDGAEAVGRGPYLFGRKIRSIFGEVLAGHLERIEQRRDEGVDAGKRPPHPWLDIGFGLRLAHDFS